MAQPKYQSLKGMHDLLPPESERWRRLIATFADEFGRAGYGYLQTPVLEERAVFARVGDGTDVVTKEMYEFVDRDGTLIALRPESTAGVARSFIQHQPAVPWKVWYSSSHFRHENTQAGRYRQHHQLGAECFGAADPEIDAELIVGLWDFYKGLGLSELTLEVNSIGDPDSRTRYGDSLRKFLRTRIGDLHPLDQEKVERHPMRVLDSKRPATLAALQDVPLLVDELSDASRVHFERVVHLLGQAKVPVSMNFWLVRGLDYYTHTVFEIVSNRIEAAQATIGGGGRYNGLVEALGGRPTPGVGFGTGIERVLLACDAEQCLPPPSYLIDSFVVSYDRDFDEAERLCRDLRRAGVGSDRMLNQHNPRKQSERARRAGARFVVRRGLDQLESHQVELVDSETARTVVVDRADAPAVLKGIVSGRDILPIRIDP